MSSSPSKSPTIVQRDAKALAAGYSSGFRIFEILAITLFFGLCVLLGTRLAPVAAENPVWFGLALVIGWFAADFGSGVVHWAGDTWGTTEVPIVGQSLIRTFREHHVDQTAITRHDFVETNGSNCMATLPFLVGALFIDLENLVGVLGATFCLTLSVWVFLTNQIHSWAHETSPPKIARWLQRSGLILSPEHHSLHHAVPFDRAYCITSGKMNPILGRIDFFRRAERVITALTGAVPRRDDIGLDAALEIAPMQPEVPVSQERA